MIEKNNKEPYINIWFGNFYKPAFDDKNFIEKNIKLIKKLGFNSIMLDSKAWQDFRDRFNGLPASQYVEMQEFMQKVAKENNISHQFLALYLNGDNLYPYIRFSPPIYGESIITAKGIDGKWYRYWSDKAKQSMTEHVSGLMKMYSKNYTTVEINGEEKLPLCSMWDPIVAPSFDDDGKQRYLNWLKKQYKNNIEFFNKAYGTSFSDFNALTKEDYWFECAYPDKKTYSLESLKKMLPECIMWTDNIKWKIEELCLYFEDMEKRLHHINKKFYLCPNMAQWGYFLNIDGSMLSNVGFSNLWDTAMRGIDIYKLSKYVDSCHFITVPVTPFGDADAYVVSCQHSMMRVMNSNKGFIGGIYWGRFLYNNIYETLTPCEIVGSIVASGAKAYSSYGICGLDDGGLLDRMDDYFLSSLETANNWMKKIVPLIKDKKGPKIAILFPSAMAAFEPMYIEGNKERRMDLLGWYKSCCDSGYQADIIDIDSINNEILKNYKILIIPANDCYSLQTNKKAEFELEKWVSNGGIIIHSPNDKLIENALGILGKKYEQDAIFYKAEGYLPQSEIYFSYEGEEILSKYAKNNLGSIVRKKYGKGEIYSFGFYYGYSYCSKIIPHVPIEYKNDAFYPISMMKSDILHDILLRYEKPFSFNGKNIEISEFKNGVIIINHNSVPIDIKNINGQKYFQYPINETLLLPRTAVFVEY